MELLLPLRAFRICLVKIKKRISPFLALLAVTLVGQAAQQPLEMPLWPDGLPDGPSVELEEVWTERPIEDGAEVELDRSVKDISTPTLTVYFPTKQNELRTSMVILPGGGFGHLAIDKEGHDIARWLNSHGITGIVVKYRVVQWQIEIQIRISKIEWFW